ncbi:MAG: hypothetical protein HRU28_18060 [Rhizobiales bacterium]|nr:hypothetical protein [Hyphomicrobiales bacterium]
MRDFYYDFRAFKILSKSDPDFSISYVLEDMHPDHDKPFSFVLQSGDFMINFAPALHNSDTDWNAINASAAKNGVMTLIFDHIGTCASWVHIQRHRCPEATFPDVETQTNILKLFKQAMLAFPTTFEIERKKALLQDIKVAYGPNIEFTDKLMKEINSGELIK